MQAWDDLGVHYAMLDRFSGKALDVTGGSALEGTLIQQWDLGSRPQEIGHSFPSEPYLMLSVASQLAVDVTNGTPANGPLSQGWLSNGNKQQQWQLLPRVAYNNRTLLSKTFSILLW